MEKLHPAILYLGGLLWILLTAWGAWFCGLCIRRVRAGADLVSTLAFGPPEMGLAGGISILWINGIVADLISSEPARQVTAHDFMVSSGFNLLMVGFGFALLVLRKFPVVEYLGLRKFTFAKLGFTLLFFVAVIMMVQISLLVTQMLVEQRETQEAVDFLLRAAKEGATRDLAIGIFFSVVVAPITEELMFRGLIYPAFKRYFGMVPAMVFTSVLFSLVHGNVFAAFPLLVLAIGFTLAYELTGSIFSPIVMHVCFNSLNILAMLAGVGQGK